MINIIEQRAANAETFWSCVLLVRLAGLNHKYVVCEEVWTLSCEQTMAFDESGDTLPQYNIYLGLD